MTIAKNSLKITWIGLAGYALTAPASIAASQLFFGVAVTAFLFYLILYQHKSSLVFPPFLIILSIAAFIIFRFISMVKGGTDVFMIREEWLFLMALFGAVVFQDIRNLARLLDVFAAGIIIMGGYGIWQHFVGVDLYHQVLLSRMIFGYRAIGTFSTYLTFSGFFAIAAIFLVPAGFTATSKFRKIYYLLASQISLACILFNYSRSTIVALVIGVVFLIILVSARYRKWIALLLLLTMAVGIVVSPDFLDRFRNLTGTEFSIKYANSRLAIWQTALSMIEEKPVFGVGPGNFDKEYIALRQVRVGRNLSHAHNDILNVAAESGIICALLYLLMWGIVVVKLYKGYIKCPDGWQKGLILGTLLSSVVFFVMSQFEAFFADEEVRLLLMFFWGIGLAVLGNLKASEKLSEIA
ncbi:MAG: O-antigen ligase family protein [candidate division Zixibacteria bacterium]